MFLLFSGFYLRKIWQVFARYIKNHTKDDERFQKQARPSDLPKYHGYGDDVGFRYGSQATWG